MKGIHGLIVAIVLGLAGAAANFYYLNTEAQKKDMVAFIGIKQGVILGRGDKLTEDKLVKVEIPANHVGNLKIMPVSWEERVGVKDMRVWRTLDSKTIPKSGSAAPAKRCEDAAQGTGIGQGRSGEGHRRAAETFDTSLVNPGDKISFRVTTLAPPGPTPAARPAAAPRGGRGRRPQPRDRGAPTGSPSPRSREAPPPARGSQ